MKNTINHLKQNKAGFTLIDIIIGCGLFIAIITMFFTWLLYTLELSDSILKRFEATNYARSGIEFVEAIRNRATLKRTTLHSLLFPTHTHIEPTSCFILDDTILSSSSGISPWSITETPCTTFDDDALLREPSLQQAYFKRIVRIESVNPSSVTNIIPHPSSTISITPSDITLIQVKTAWFERGKKHIMSLEKYLTSWPSLQ